ncbi:SMI1/KNR4 family protein [Rugosimonospora africana]|uniref:Knr4/Smi1-like domain-containing protein n=1 Tax=Rugosimonospora africana TaxID=556532 RepID=A0A8J3QVI4_9ACTN|nr:SMI1/KNR4 family protein [Rugosimonospora africana]GIH16553.1 hypothetical protein Raf01_47250 [Rugosimonospora africana]
MVRIAPVPRGFTVDEARLVDVLIANRLVAGAIAGAAGWEYAADRAPAGWIWAHLGATRHLALVPAELHAAFRHRGGVSGMRVTVPGRGLLTGKLVDDTGAPVPVRPVRTVAEDAVGKLEGWLGYRLPDGYREFLAATNGGLPLAGAVVPGTGLLLDQPLFGLATEDRMQDLAYANLWLRDRLTRDFLAVGYVQGGLLAVKVRGHDAGSVWYWDDDDSRDDERYEPAVICRDLLVRCAANFPELLAGLSTVPPSLSAVADRAIEHGRAELFRPDGVGDALPKARRPPWLTLLENVPTWDPTAQPG